MPISIIFTYLLWIILNGKVTVEILLIGVKVTAIVAYFTYKLTRTTFALERRITRKIFGIIEYLVILVVEVYKANMGVVQIILDSEAELKPTLGYFTTDLKSNYSRVALANSITLTPGTITVTLTKDEYLIHALDASMLDGIGESIFVEKLRKLEAN